MTKQYLHTVERSNYDYDDCGGGDYEVSRDVIATFEKFEDAQEYARVHRGLNAYENAIEVNPKIPAVPEGCLAYDVHLRTDTGRATAYPCDPYNVTGEVSVHNTINKKVAVGPVLTKVGPQGELIRWQDREQVVIGHDLRCKVWAKNSSEACGLVNQKWIDAGEKVNE